MMGDNDFISRGPSLQSASAEGVTGRVVTALHQNNGIWYYWVTGHSAVVSLLASPDPDRIPSWPVVVTVTAGAAGAGETGSVHLTRHYGYLCARVDKAASAAGGSAIVNDYLSLTR